MHIKYGKLRVEMHREILGTEMGAIYLGGTHEGMRDRAASENAELLVGPPQLVLDQFGQPYVTRFSECVVLLYPVLRMHFNMREVPSANIR